LFPINAEVSSFKSEIFRNSCYESNIIYQIIRNEKFEMRKTNFKRGFERK